MVSHIYPSGLQLNKVSVSDTEAPFLDLHSSTLNGFVTTKFRINEMEMVLICILLIVLF